MDIRELVVCENDEGSRLDVFISKHLNDISRSYVQKLIDEEKISVCGKLKKSNYKIKFNDKIVVSIPEPVKLNVEAEDIPLEILYEDSDIIVVNKHQGMVVHPAAGNYTGTMVNALLNHCSDLSGINGVYRPGIVHRIDKDTSGILVVAKNDNAHKCLAEQLKNHSMTRIYSALAEGVIKNDEGTIDAPLGRHPVERKKITVINGGRRAVTHFKVLERFNQNTLIECRLETGRTHQIRVHMAYIGHPLVGDLVYGYKKQKFNLNGQALHAGILGFIHPKTLKYIQFEAPLPPYFIKLLNNLRNELK